MEPAYGLARSALWPALHFGMRWTIEDAHVIPVRGPVLIASNHVSYLDPLVLAYVANRRHRNVRFLAKAELFDHRALGPLLRAARQIPVQRETAGAAGSLDAAVEALEHGECVVVFPEGTISLDLDPMPGKSGTVRLAQRTGVRVTPVGLWGAQRLLFKGRRPRWRAGVAESVVVGAPMSIAPDEDTGAATDRVMGAIASAVARARSLYPQRPGPDDDGWWVRTPQSAFRHTTRSSA